MPKSKKQKKKSEEVKSETKEAKYEFKLDPNFKSTKEIKVPDKIVDQVIGQEDAVNIIKKAAEQRRHVLLIGEPGTGKSMLGLALAELLPKEKLVDIISFPNPNDENQPLIRTVPAGQGRDIVTKSKIQAMGVFSNQNIIMFILVVLAMIAPWWARSYYNSDVMFAAFFLGGMMFLVAFVIFINVGRKMTGQKIEMPKLIVDNFDKKHIPFFDATGAHAGALLGDVLHDPFQCFFPSTKVTTIDSNIKKDETIKSKVDSILSKKKQIIKKEERNYEAAFTDKNELYISGEQNGFISPAEVLSSNRHNHNGEMIKLTTSENKELIVTPNHKIAVCNNGKIKYIEAEKLKEGDSIVAVPEEIIIDEQDIINTYDKRQQQQCRLYHQYLDIKQNNFSWGYKRIANAMDQPIGKTRWWHEKMVPVPIQTVAWLKERRLLPLRKDNPNAILIAKIIGSTFGDGGIFENLNGLFLSSSEKEAVEEFGNDLATLFGKEVAENSRVIEGGEKGHSWCYQNTNRNVIRFFLALGAPKGNKTKSELKIPAWIYLSNDFSDEFFGSFFGSELGVPKVHKQKNRLQTLDVVITGSKALEENRLDFLNRIKRYLDYKCVESTAIYKGKTNNMDLSIYRLMISVKFDNALRFLKSVKINYCRYKKEKLVNALNEFSQLKKAKYGELITRGYGAEHAMKVLQLTTKSLYAILNEEKVEA